MRIGPNRWRHIPGSIPDARVALSPRQHKRILDAICPHLLREELAEKVLDDVRACIAAYMFDLAIGMGPEAKLQPQASTAAELDALAEAASALERAIYEMSDEVGARLHEHARRIAAPASDEPEAERTAEQQFAASRPDWIAPEESVFTPGWLLYLEEECHHLARLAQEEAARVRAEKRPRGRPRDIAARRLAVNLALTWWNLTEAVPTRGRGDRASPWEAFAASVFEVAGAESSGVQLARDAAAFVRRREQRHGPIPAATERPRPTASETPGQRSRG